MYFCSLVLPSDPLKKITDLPHSSHLFDVDQLEFDFMNDEIETASHNNEKKTHFANETASINREDTMPNTVDEIMLSDAEIMTEVDVNQTSERSENSLGQRLRAARMKRRWSEDEVARQLRLPVSIVQTIESDDYQRIEHTVYLRGYLRSYLRLVDLPTALAERIIEGVDEIPPLITTGQISHSRYLFERYSVPAVYLILTGLIVMPAVWMATHGGLEQNLARIALLDVPVEGSLLPDQISSVKNPALEVSTAAMGAAEISNRSAIPESSIPLVASMAPFYSHSANQTGNVTDQSPTSSITANTAKTLRLNLSEASWVEVLDPKGQRLEYGLLTAGTEREYPRDTTLNVRIGNANAATLEVDGRKVDLTPYRSGNVAHLKILEKSEGIQSADF